MDRKAYKTWVLFGAMEVITKRYPGGKKQAASYFIGGEEVAYLVTEKTGTKLPPDSGPLLLTFQTDTM